MLSAAVDLFVDHKYRLNNSKKIKVLLQPSKEMCTFCQHRAGCVELQIVAKDTRPAPCPELSCASAPRCLISLSGAYRQIWLSP